MTSFEEAAHSLQFENSQLRTELKAQQIVNMKLRKEKDDTLLALHECKEENRLLYEELKLRDQMFQEYREQKEREIVELTAIKGDLEVRLQRCGEEGEQVDGSSHFVGGVLVSPDDYRFVGASLPQLNAQEVVDALSRWDGMEDTIALFSDLLNKNGSVDWVPGSPWTSKWQFSISLYISSTPDCEEMVNTLMREYVPLWQKQCKDGGCSLTSCHFQPSSVAQFPVDSDYMTSVCSSEVNRSDIFVCLLKETSSSTIKLEVEHGHLNNPLARPSVFLLVPSNGSDAGSSDIEALKVRVRKTGGHARVMECAEDLEDGLVWLSDQIQTILKKKFALPELVEGDSEEAMKRISLLEDMRVECQQRQILEHYVHQAPPELFGVEMVYDCLEEYMKEESPVPPLLLTGHPGLGKSTLLAKWIDHLEHGGSHNLVLYHFVTCLGSPTSEPGVIFRRLLKKIKYVCGEPTSLPTVPSHLMECFTDYLERLSVAKSDESGMAVIVIDGADLIKDCEHSLHSLIQPLPNNIRIVLSANEENYPDSWRALPSPSIPTPTSQDMQDIVEFVVADRETLSLEQVGTLAVEAPSIPLWGVLATQHALSIRAESSDVVDDIIDSLITQKEVGELICVVLKELEERCPWMAYSIEQVLKVIYWSRNGVLFNELLEITALPETLLRLTVCEFQRRSILHCCGGLFHLSHHDVQDAIQLKYSHLSSSENMLHWTEQLTTYYLKSPNSLMCRTAEEVPWHLQRADLKKELYHTIISVDILVQLYAGGYGEEILRYWKQLDQSPNVMATQYYTVLRSIEEKQDENTGLSPEGVCSMFRTVGKVVNNLGFSDEALPLLQHYLQLCEAHFEPDGVEVATAFTEIAEAYTHIGRYGAAEEYYYQALEIFEGNPDVFLPQAVKVIEALVGVLKKLKRMDVAQALSTKAFAMKNMTKLNNTPSNILKKRAAHLEQFCSQLEADVDIDSAHKLNEYAVLLTLFGDSSLAEELFLRSWKAYESQAGDGHLMVVKPLQNLALFYIQTGSVEKATSLYEKVYEILKQNNVGPSHQMTEIIGKLAMLYRQQNRLDLAEPFQVQFAELKERELGPHHLNVARALNNLAVIYSMQDDYAKALPTYDRALKAYRYNFPEDHPTVSTVVQNRQLAVHILEQLT